MFGFLNSKSTQTTAGSSVRRIYLDYASATPVLPAVINAMMPYFAADFGNPSAIHAEGVKAKAAITHARAQVAQILQVKPEGITFTSGGTESNNLAILGTVAARHSQGTPYADMEIITTKLEHPATLQTVVHLEHEGVTVHYAPVDGEGKIVLSEFEKLLSPRTVLVTVGYVNSEIGTITDIGALSRVIRVAHTRGITRTLLHVDAAQAPLWLPCEVSRLGVDLLSLDAGKFCGPKGIGVLAHRKGVVLESVSYGGGQEAGLRPGTEPVPLVVGCAEALVWAHAHWQERQEKVTSVREYTFAALSQAIPPLIINGARAHGRVANNVNISIPEINSEFAVIALDVAGIACSTKSACSAAGGGESAVVKTISNDSVRAASTLRFTLGPETTHEQIDYLATTLAAHYNQQLAARPHF